MSDLVPAFTGITSEFGLYPTELRTDASQSWVNLTVSFQGVDGTVDPTQEELHCLLDSRWHPDGFTVGPETAIINGSSWQALHVHFTGARPDNDGKTLHWDISVPAGGFSGWTGTRILWVGVKTPAVPNAWLWPIIYRLNENFARTKPDELEP